MSRLRVAPFLVLAASASGCSALLGVEEVALDDGAGGGGVGGGDAGGAGGPWALGPFSGGGAASDRPDGPTTTVAGPGSGGAPATSGDSAAAGGPSGGGATVGPTSAASGGGCVQDRPACPGLVPSRFEDDASLDAWLVESPKAKVKGKKLELDPEDDDDTASVRSVASLAPSASCAVWVTRQDGHDGLTRLSLLGADGGERVAIAWGGSVATAYADGVEVGAVSASDGAARLLRIRLEADGAHLEIRSADTTCWETVAGPVPVAAPDGPVRLAYAGHGKVKLDDYAVP